MNSVYLHVDLSAAFIRLILINVEKNKTHLDTVHCISSCCFLQAGPYMDPGHLCSVPMVEAPGDAMSKCSGDIQGAGPTSRHKTTRKTHNQMIIFCRSVLI